MEPNYSDAKLFVETLYEHETLTFQTASKNDDIKPTFKHGTLDQHWDWLVDQNGLGANIYIMVNEGDGRGRKLHNVKAIISTLVDQDGGPIDPVLSCDLKPNIITETSEGRYQGLWRVRRTPVARDTRYSLDDLYKRIHSGIANKFNSDPATKSLSHVCRLPGFINHNHTPFVSRVYKTFDSAQLSIEDFVESLSLDLTQTTYINDYHPLTDGNGVPIDNEFAAGSPIPYHFRNETLLRILFRLAYTDIVGDELIHQALNINSARCNPRLNDNEVIGLARKVTRFFAGVTDDQLIERIRECNSGLRTHNGQFYRYDSPTGQYRMIELRALRNRIYLESKWTANDRRIKEVLQKLADNTKPCENMDNPEKRFIKECLTVGGKSVLKEIYSLYENWCVPKIIKPASQSSLRKEIEDIYPGTYRKSIRVGKRFHRGFHGISIK